MNNPAHSIAVLNCSGNANRPELSRTVPYHAVEKRQMKEALCAACSWPQEKTGERGLVENLLFPFCVLFQNQNLKQSSFLFLQISRGQGWRLKEAQPRHPPPPPPHLLSPVGRQGPTGRAAFRVGSQSSTSLPHCGYVGGSPSPAGTVFGGLASAPLTISLALENHQTRLCNSVRPASSQVQGHSVYLCVEQRCSCLACKNRGPIGEGRDRACPSS